MVYSDAKCDSGVGTQVLTSPNTTFQCVDSPTEFYNRTKEIIHQGTFQNALVETSGRRATETSRSISYRPQFGSDGIVSILLSGN